MVGLNLTTSAKQRKKVVTREKTTESCSSATTLVHAVRFAAAAVPQRTHIAATGTPVLKDRTVGFGKEKKLEGNVQ